MRTYVAPALAALLCLHAPLALGAEGDERVASATFVNHQVSARRIAVNQPLRLEFTTMPRQVEGVDIAAALVNGIELTAGANWRILGKPIVKEQEKTKTVTAAVTLLPRVTGDLELPRPPMSWLTGEPKPSFGIITVSQSIAVGGETRPLPPEFDGVGGFSWGSKQAEVVEASGSPATVQGDRTLVRPVAGLTLIFRSEALAEATVLAPGLALDQARASFLERWGIPLTEDASGLTWILGWTKITATPGPDGTLVTITREDLAARQAAAQVKGRVFQLLDGPTK